MTVRFSSLHTAHPPMSEARRRHVHGPLARPSTFSQVREIMSQFPVRQHAAVAALIGGMIVLFGIATVMLDPLSPSAPLSPHAEAHPSNTGSFGAAAGKGGK